MTANIAASAITVVSMPASERLVAISCPCWEVKKICEIIFNLSNTTLSCNFKYLLLSYLAEGGTLCHYDVKLAFDSSVLEEGLHGARATYRHDDLVRVDVLQSLHCNVVSCSLWKMKWCGEKKQKTKLHNCLD